MTYICKFCGLEKEYKNFQQFGSHVASCYQNPNFSIRIRKTREFNLQATNNKLGELKLFKVNCFKCSKEFEVKERTKQFPKKEKYFCSRRCANSRTWSESDKNKKSISAKKSEKILMATKNRNYSKLRTAKRINCIICNKLTKNKKFCCIKCYKQNLTLKPQKEIYRKKCQFNFSLSDYPNEFDFELIKKYGWYKSKKHKDYNLNGVSRDHMYSISEGFKNNIDPTIISHPANCVLMKHSDNNKKDRKCSITIKNLLLRIKQWDKTYPPVSKGSK